MRALGSSDGTISSNNNNFWSEGPTHLEVECEKSNKWEVPDTIKLNEAIHGKNATFSFRKISVKRNLLLREEWFRQTASTALAQSRWLTKLAATLYSFRGWSRSSRRGAVTSPPRWRPQPQFFWTTSSRRVSHRIIWYVKSDLDCQF